MTTPGTHTFVVATFNPHKATELHALLGLPGLTLRAVSEWPGAVAPVEDGDTLLANALLKARAACALTGLPSIADDTGLEVDALDGAPGVFTARYAGAEATYADNVAKLLRELEGVAPERRTARFRTACVAMWPDGRTCVSEGVVEGAIVTAPRGTNGFGYDPVFAPAVGDGTRTFAEMHDTEKNTLSHRARAVHALADQLRV